VLISSDVVTELKTERSSGRVKPDDQLKIVVFEPSARSVRTIGSRDYLSQHGIPNALREPRRFSGVGSTLLFGIYHPDHSRQK
jgi:hypothetical protein